MSVGNGRLVALVVLVLLIGAGTVAALTLAPIDGFDWTGESLAELVESWGIWGQLAVIGLMIVHSFVPFPAEIVAFAAGMCYGWVHGTVLTWVGAMIGAIVAFALARAFGRPFVETVLTRKQCRTLDSWTLRQGTTTLLTARFVPVISFNLINYAAGLTSIGWMTFLWTTGLGILPLTTLMVVLGDHMRTLTTSEWLVLTFATAALFVGVVAVHELRRRRRGRQAVSLPLRRSPRPRT